MCPIITRQPMGPPGKGGVMADELRVVFRREPDGTFKVVSIEEGQSDDTQGHVVSPSWAAWSALHHSRGDYTNRFGVERIGGRGDTRYRLTVDGDDVSGHLIQRGREDQSGDDVGGHMTPPTPIIPQ